MPIQKITSGILDPAALPISSNIYSGTSNVSVLSSGGAVSIGTNGTEALRVTSNGWVGVGTTTPANTFTVKGTGIVSERSSDTDRLITTYNDINDYANATGGTNHNVFTLRQSNNTTSNNRLRVTATGLFQFDSGYGDIATAYGCRAWVNFNGTGTIAIRGSGNVSSITDNGTGNYFINFASALTDANYSVTGIGGHIVGVVTTFSSVREGTRTTSGVQVDYFTVSSTYYDTNDANIAVFR
jgi:hypothetical protein